MPKKPVKVFLIAILLASCTGIPTHPKHTPVHNSMVDTSNELNHNEVSTEVNSVHQTKSVAGYLSTGVNAVQRMVNKLPSPTQVLNYGKQVLIGVPEEIATKTKLFLCSEAVKLNDIVKEYHPQLDDLNFEFLTQDQDNVTIPLSDPQHLFNHPKFHMNWNVVLFVTGWNSNISDEIVSALYDAYRCRTGYNFLVLDTFEFVSSMYAWSEFSTEPVGELIGEAIRDLTRFVPYDRIHLIGNDIGAHIAGMAGRHFTQLTGNALLRITGLDPSRPCFSHSDRSNGLQRGDAIFVDIIHSNIQVWPVDPIGDADFYPNGPNIIQPGCWSTSCTTNYAYQFYAQTVYPRLDYSFNATKCDSFSSFRTGNCNNASSQIPLGISTPNWARGNFFLTFQLADMHRPSQKYCNNQ